MYELDEKKYLYLLLIIPILVLVFLYNLYWKRKKQREFGDLELVKKLSPEKSIFKHSLKLGALVIGFRRTDYRIGQSKNRDQNGNRKTRRHRHCFCGRRFQKYAVLKTLRQADSKKASKSFRKSSTSLRSDRIGIVAYAGSAFPVLPITTDYSVAKMFLQSMNPEWFRHKELH